MDEPEPTNDSQQEPSDPIVESEIAPVTNAMPAADIRSHSMHPLIRLFAGLLIIMVTVVAAFGVYTLVKSQLNKSTVTKASLPKEIPLVTVGLVSDGSGADFYPAAKNLDNGYDFNQQVFEGLVQFKNINQIKPNLATSWTNPDDNTWDFKLEKNVMFHTGRTMTAADVKYSLDNFKDTELGKIYNDTIMSVQVVNDYEVTVTTKAPDPLLLNKLAYLSIVDSQSKLQNSAENGTGPYTIKPGTTPTENDIQLVAFDGWHGGRPLTRAVNYKGYVDEPALADGVIKGEVNTTIVVFEADNIAAIRKSAKLKEISAPNVGVSLILINTNKAKSTLANVKVRQALYASFDLDNLAKARGIEVEVNNQLAPPAIPGYNPQLPVHVRDISAAKALLTAAGYPKGVTVNVAYYNQTGGLPDEIVKEAKDAGITVKLTLYDDLDKLEADITAGKLDSWGYSVSTQLLDMSDIYTGYVKKWYSNPTIDSLLDQSNKTLDGAKRLAMLQQISKELSDNVAFIPFYVRLEHWYADPTFVITRDRGGEPFGVNWGTVYATIKNN